MIRRVEHPAARPIGDTAWSTRDVKHNNEITTYLWILSCDGVRGLASIRALCRRLFQNPDMVSDTFNLYPVRLF